MSDATSDFEFDCTMTCSGCSGAIDRVLKRAQTNGVVKEYSVDLASQRVKVTPAQGSYDDVLGIIRKTGKAVNIGKKGPEPAEAYTPVGEAKLASF